MCIFCGIYSAGFTGDSRILVIHWWFTHPSHSLVIYASSSTLQEIYKDRKKFSKAVFEVASSDLVNMGISVVSYTLKDIRDEEVCFNQGVAELGRGPGKNVRVGVIGLNLLLVKKYSLLCSGISKICKMMRYVSIDELQNMEEGLGKG